MDRPILVTCSDIDAERQQPLQRREPAKARDEIECSPLGGVLKGRGRTSDERVERDDPVVSLAFLPHKGRKPLAKQASALE
jgi:hypothetical protein